MEKEVSITLSVQAWNTVMNALGQRPFLEVADLISSIKIQAEQQIRKKPQEDSEE
jgi:hypothetical protein